MRVPTTKPKVKIKAQKEALTKMNNLKINILLSPHEAYFFKKFITVFINMTKLAPPNIA